MKYTSLLASLLICGMLSAQNSQIFHFPKTATINQMDEPFDWDFRVSPKAVPYPGGESYRQFINAQKDRIADFEYPQLPEEKLSEKGASGPGEVGLPRVEELLIAELNDANDYGTPNDNDLAVDSGKWAMSVVNSKVQIYDLQNNDSLVLSKTLRSFAPPSSIFANNDFDPKVLFDPEADRWIFWYLVRNSAQQLTQSIMAFSQTNDPTGNWNVYEIDGNPLNNTTWSDYPQWALTQNELFISLNLIAEGGSWQDDFDRTIVWQIDKNSGYGDSATLTTKLWSDFEYEAGRSMRYLNPVEGGGQLYGPNCYFVSNHPWDITNDTFYLVEITGLIDDTTSTVNITPLISPLPYGFPPNAKMTDSSFLMTNDARVLGSFIENGDIHFVGNTINPGPKRAAFYHGIIDFNPLDLSMNLISSTEYEFGYPNISYTSQPLLPLEALISVNHTGTDAFPGMSVWYYSDENGLSERRTIIDGQNWIELLSSGSDSLERWGDYTGSVRALNDPGAVWVSGYYATTFGVNDLPVGGTIIAKVRNSTVTQTSIESISEIEHAIKLYPNPIQTYFSMEFDLDQQEVLRFRLFDLSGKLVKEFGSHALEPGAHRLRFETGHLSEGSYQLTIDGDKGFQQLSRLISR